MKLHRLLGALCAALLFVLPSFAAEQSSYVTPVAGPMNMATFASSHLNPALRALASCHNGSSAPANGPSSAPLAYQCWVDTTANPALYKIYDGASWITLGSINTSTHVWLPYLTGGASGGVPYFSNANVMGSSAALAQNGPVIGGGAGAAPSTITAGTDDQVLFGRTGNSPLFRSVTGDVTLSAGVSAIGANKVTNGMFRQSGPLAIVGRATNSTGDVADISASAGSSCAFRESSNSIGCGTLATAAYANNSVTDAKLRQSAALSVVGRASNSTGDVADISASAGSSCAFRENSNTVGCGTLATAAFANNAVTNAKLAQMANNTVKCRVTAGTGDPEDCSATQGRSVLGLGTAATQNIGTSGANVPLLNGGNTHGGNNTFTGTNDFQSPIKLSSFVTSTQITANQNNYTATDGSNTCATKQTLRISSDASRNVTGLSCGQAEGDIRLIHNVGSQNIPLLNEDSNSTAANRFAFGGDVTLQPNYSITIRYDGAASRWRAITTATGGGGGGGTVTSVTVAAGAGINVSGTNPITTSGTVTVSQSNDTIGEVVWMTTSRVPTNHLKADGSTVSRATFPLLAAKYVISSTVTFTNGSDDISWTAHGLSSGDRIKFFTSGSLPTNFTAGTHGAPTSGTSYCVSVNGLGVNSFRVSATCGGSTIVAGSAGSGTQTAVNAPWGSGDGSTTFTLPNFIGQFLRGWNGSASGTDANRMFGAAQDDAFQGHRHSLSPSINSNSSAAVSNTTLNVTATVPQTNIIVGDPITDGVNGTPRTANETRPVNYAVMPVIRYQ